MRRFGVCSREKSGNEKTGILNTTYVSRESCKRDCPFAECCYGLGGKVAMILSDLETMMHLDPMSLAREESRQLDLMKADRDCRLHVTGDCMYPACARIVAGAAKRYHAKHGKKCYTYTHYWWQVDRADWGQISVMASCETAGECIKAHSRGYAVATVEGQDIENELKAAGFRVIPCPAQTRGVTCNQCRLCMKDGLLHKNKAVISFKAHGFRARLCREVVASKRMNDGK